MPENSKKKESLEELYEFIGTRKAEYGKKSTYTNMDPRRSYYIKRKDLKHFFNLFNRAKKYGNELHLTEKHRKKVTKLLLDWDVRFESKYKDRTYTKEHIKQIVKITNKVIKKYLNVSKKQLTCFVFEKKHPSLKKNMKGDLVLSKKGKKIYTDGLHFEYPFLTLKNEYNQLIIHEVREYAKKKDIFEDLPAYNEKKENIYYDMFDLGIVRNNWMLYGTCKPSNAGNSYKLTKIYDHECSSVDRDKYPEEDLAELLSIRLCKKRDAVDLNDEYTYDEIKKKISKYDQIVREIKYGKKDKPKDKERKKSEKRKKSKLRSKSDSDSDNYRDKAVEDLIKNAKTGKHTFSNENVGESKNKNKEKIKKAKKLVSLLDDGRADNYHDWIQLGWTLHNIDHSLLKTWNKFSKKSHKFVKGECEKLWNKFKNEGYTIASLYMWAKNDSPEEYVKLRKGEVDSILMQSVAGTNTQVAKVLHEMFKYEFVCASVKHKDWYEFKNHGWTNCDEGVTLYKKISTILIDKYHKLAAKIHNDISELGEDEQVEKENLKKKAQMIEKVIEKLNSTKFKTDVMTECRYLFYDPHFYEKSDEQPSLIRFLNGVYDLSARKFRDGMPEDYLTKTTGIKYQKYNPDDEQAQKVRKLFRQIQRTKSKRTYLWRLLTSCLDGHNKDERFNLLTGVGCHAKGSLIRMYDGSVKKVELIKPGEKLMGDDSTSRTVKKLFKGKDEMYRIIPIKGDSFVVNQNHILSLKATEMSCIVWSEKEKRYKMKWQEKDSSGLPIVKCKNFPIKHSRKKVYKKNCKYYKTKELAYNAAIKYLQQMKKNKKYIKKGDVIDIKLSDFIKIKEKINGFKNYFLYRNQINYQKQTINLDPYMLGYWLGDGTSKNCNITTTENEVVKYFKKNVSKYNVKIKQNDKYHYSITTQQKGGNDYKRNKMLNIFKEYNLIDNKHIPESYKHNTKKIRRAVLAGLIDSDGHYQKRSNQYEITMKSEKIIDDIVELVRSLGLACYKKQVKKTCTNSPTKAVGTYYRLQIVGDGLEKIPVLLERKKAIKRNKNKNAKLESFKIKSVGKDKFYGFELNKNHRYMDAQGYIQHNSNGKSVLGTLVSKAFGQYYDTVSVALLTQKRKGSGNASPEIAKLKGVRLVFFHEPEEDDKIQVGYMKQLTGGDEVDARKLYKEPIKFKPQCKIFLPCNKLPVVSANDKGTWRRLRVLEFDSEFVANPTKKHEFKRDDNLKQRLPDMAEAFMSMLIEVYPKYEKDGLSEPEEVIKYTDAYQQRSDILLEYINENMVKSKDEEESTSLVAAYTNFKNWFKESYSTSKYPANKRDLKDYFENKGYKVKHGNVMGMEIKTNKPKDDMDDD